MKLPIGNSRLHVLVATRDAEALAALGAVSPCEVIEALSTDGVYANLSRVQFAIVDLDDLIEGQLTRDTLWRILDQSPVLWANGASFASNPAMWRDTARAATGQFESLPARAIAIMGYSGGVGKTTLSLDTALYFAARSHLPVVVVELTHGPSALRAITGVKQGADFYDAATRDGTLANWHGVELVPMDEKVARLVAPDKVRAFFEQLCKSHILTVVDFVYPHPFFEAISNLLTDLFVIASPRPDAWANAEHLAVKVENARVVFNMVDGWGDRLTQLGLKRALDLPRLREQDRLSGRLGRELLKLIYPGWRN